MALPSAGTAADLPTSWPIEKLEAKPAPDRIVLRLDDETSTTVVGVQDEFLDLAAEVARNERPRAGRRNVPLAPRLVVGEGPHPDNHTLIKILNPHGLADIQFLAFSPEITGGVRVAAGRDGKGRTRIVAAACSSKTRELRVFNELGGSVSAIDPPKEMAPPYLVAMGDFLPNRPGDEIAILASAPGPGGLLSICGFDGSRRTFVLAFKSAPKTVTVSVRRDVTPAVLLVHDSASGQLLSITATGQKWLQSPDLIGKSGVFVSAAKETIATQDDALLSRVALLDATGRRTGHQDVGRFENLFWVVTPPRSVIGKPELQRGLHRPNEYLAALDEGRYVKFCEYGHYRTDAAGPGYRDPRFGNDDHGWWAGTPQLKRLIKERPVMWEPCFTHRGFPELLDKWEAVSDEATGLPRYMMVGRLGGSESYEELSSSFALTTYAFGLPDLDHLYLDHLSKVLVDLAEYQRTSPEANPSLEPNHENEIPMKVNDTVGDYNPKMIEGFFDYLTRQFGDLDGINAAMGTTFTEYFDAPRGVTRGAWDLCEKRNPFFSAWMHYNRYVINRRLAEGARESLLAGFAPEFIKYHQIPDTYISGGDLGFSRIQNRITPLDWAISSGTGYGWTRYGVWYKKQHNVVQGGYSAGQDAVIVGEYQSLTENPDEASAQLEYMFDHGVMGVHVMGWNKDLFNRTIAEAVKRLIALDRPRPGLTGGVGQLVSWRQGERQMDIVSLGTSARHTGLLKSLKSDGSWEGSVYSVPFKAHVDVESIPVEPARFLSPGQAVATPAQPLMLAGSQVEIVFSGKGRDGIPAILELAVYRGDRMLPGLSVTVSLPKKARHYRFVHRVQLPTEGLAFKVKAIKGSAELKDLAVYRHTARIADIAHSVPEGKRHQGGIFFDVLPNHEGGIFRIPVTRILMSADSEGM